MIKLIIADKEIANINGIKTYIESTFSYINIEKTFYSEENIEYYFDQENYYILIMDLRFFSDNFYKKIKNFKLKYPKVSIIIYGKIDDVEYLKKIEQELGILYTLRPVKPSNLKKCIEGSLYEIEAKQNLTDYEISLERLYRTNFNIFEQIFLNTLILGRIAHEDEIKQAFNYFNIKYKKDFVVAIVRIDRFRHIISEFDEKQKHFLILKLLDIVNKNSLINKAFINSFNEVVIIFSEIENLDQTLPILKEIKFEAKTKIDLDISIGIGRAYSDVKNIKTSFNEANFALRHRFIIGKNSIIFIDQVEAKNTYTASYPWDREHVFVHSAVIGQYEYCMKILDEIFIVLEKSKEVYEKIISQFVMSLLISINRTYAEKGNSNENINKFFDISNVTKLKTLDDAYEFLKVGLKRLCNYISKEREEYENKLYQDAISYINEKYYEQINYKFMAEKLNCNIEYLKHIFEVNSNDNIYDYLHKIRIEEAKNLIMKTHLKDDAIAVKVGYDDVNIFRSMFKKYEGYLAGDFRAIHKDYRGYSN